MPYPPGVVRACSGAEARRGLGGRLAEVGGGILGRSNQMPGGRSFILPYTLGEGCLQFHHDPKDPTF